MERVPYCNKRLLCIAQLLRAERDRTSSDALQSASTISVQLGTADVISRARNRANPTTRPDQPSGRPSSSLAGIGDELYLDDEGLPSCTDAKTGGKGEE